MSETMDQQASHAITTTPQEIHEKALFLARVAEDAQRRYEGAERAGGDLAAALYRFLTTPTTGADFAALEVAYDSYMAHSAGGFLT